jgi:predicted phosphodiesterase
VPPIAGAVDEGDGSDALRGSVALGDKILPSDLSDEHFGPVLNRTGADILCGDLDHERTISSHGKRATIRSFTFSLSPKRKVRACMRVAVISDIHGFSFALDRVLADITAQPAIDRVIAAGDLAEGGPDPAGAVDRLRAAGIRSVQGNTDRDLASGVRNSTPARWVSQQLGKERLAWLGGLPFEIRVSPPGSTGPANDLLVVHANPQDMNRHLDPKFSDDEVREILADTQAAVIAFGHLHIAYQRVVDDIQLIDVSAVGNSKDEDLRSKWGLMTWDEAAGQWQTELRYVDYPLEETIEQLKSVEYPNWRKAVKKLERASYKAGG